MALFFNACLGKSKHRLVLGMQGHFSDEALQEALSMYVEEGVIESFSEYYDFGATCMRPDGSLYGISGGKCRKGNETSKVAPKAKRGRPKGVKNVPKAAPGDTAARMKAAYDKLVGLNLSKKAPSDLPVPDKASVKKSPEQSVKPKADKEKPKLPGRINEKWINIRDAREVENYLNNYQHTPRERKLMQDALKERESTIQVLRKKSTEELLRLEKAANKDYMGAANDHQVALKQLKHAKLARDPERIAKAQAIVDKAKANVMPRWDLYREIKGEVYHRNLKERERQAAMNVASRVLKENNPAPTKSTRALLTFAKEHDRVKQEGAKLKEDYENAMRAKYAAQKAVEDAKKNGRSPNSIKIFERDLQLRDNQLSTAYRDYAENVKRQASLSKKYEAAKSKKGKSEGLTEGTHFARRKVDEIARDVRTATETGKLKTTNGTKPDFDFESAKKGKKLAEGAYGAALKVDGNPPTVVKVGKIGMNEAAIIAKAAKAGVAPNLLKAEVAPTGSTTYGGIPIGTGRLAMEYVSGRPVGRGNPPLEIRDKIIAQRAAMNKAGIAHNDLHIENVMWNRSDGSIKFLDFGLAQDNRRAALGEALGGVTKTHGKFGENAGDWGNKGDQQFLRWKEFGPTPDGKIPKNMERINNNVEKVKDQMRKDGFSSEDVKFFTEGSHFRKPDAYYNEKTAWSNMTDDQAERYTAMLYEGVS